MYVMVEKKDKRPLEEVSKYPGIVLVDAALDR